MAKKRRQHSPDQALSPLSSAFGQGIPQSTVSKTNNPRSAVERMGTTSDDLPGGLVFTKVCLMTYYLPSPFVR
jgi:hypothetical protein